MRSTSACGGSHLVAQPVSGGLHSFLGAGAQQGANAALAGTGHGFSEMHALSIFGVKVRALNIEKKIRRETLQDLARQLACRKIAFKHSYAVECGKRLCVEVHAKNASVSGFACRSC